MTWLFYKSYQIQASSETQKWLQITFFIIQPGCSKGDFLKIVNSKNKNWSQLASIILRNKLENCHFSQLAKSNFTLFKTINIYGLFPQKIASNQISIYDNLHLKYWWLCFRVVFFGGTEEENYLIPHIAVLLFFYLFGKESHKLQCFTSFNSLHSIRLN